jgi:hypothetical protein
MKNKTLKKIGKYYIDYVAQTKVMNSSSLERNSRALITECELEIQRLIRANNIKLKTIKRLKKCTKI